MNIEIRTVAYVAVVTITGSVDGTTADSLQSALRGYVEDGHTQLVADLDGVDYTSSAGLRALLATVKAARQHGGDLRLTRIKPNVLKVLELSGFTSILKIYPDADIAVASYAAT